MSVEITVTQENIKEFPLHCHDKWEYMLYTNGTGFLKTDSGVNYKFSPDTFIAVPPNKVHGSSSGDYFVNICIHSNKKLLLGENNFTVIENVNEEVKILFRLISKVYFGEKNNAETVNYLLFALANLLKKSTNETEIQKAVSLVHSYISENFQAVDCDINSVVNSYGFSDDYFRIQFEKRYDLTPYQYLIQLRMNYAKMLLETYGSSLKVYEIARLCGYKDGLYFSKQFKNYFGISPQLFKFKGE